MVHVSKPRSANHSMADECGRPGTCRSKVGCEAIDEPCTKKIVPRAVPDATGLCQRNSLMSPFLIQCSEPFMDAKPSVCGRKRRFYARIRRPRERRLDGDRHRDAGHVSEAADASRP